MSAGPYAQFVDTLAQGAFRIQRCKACREHFFYPRALCPHCGDDGYEWVDISTKATVYSCTTIRRKAEAGGDYNVALVDLAEGPRLMSRVEGVLPEQVRIGMNVIARIVKDPSKGNVLVFVPQEGEAS